MTTMVLDKHLVAWLFLVVMSMTMVMASMLFCNHQAAGLFAVAVAMIMASVLFCNHLVARLFAVAVAVVMASMLFRRLLVAWLFVVGVTMSMIMATVLTSRQFFATACRLAWTI